MVWFEVAPGKQEHAARHMVHSPLRFGNTSLGLSRFWHEQSCSWPSAEIHAHTRTGLLFHATHAHYAVRVVSVMPGRATSPPCACSGTCEMIHDVVAYDSPSLMPALAGPRFALASLADLCGADHAQPRRQRRSSEEIEHDNF